MKINLEVEHANGEKTAVVCSAPDIVKFEDRYDIAITKAAQDMKLTHLLFLAHAAMLRQGKTKLNFEDWTLDVEGIGASDSPK